jgi:23S rRNA pseudouridine955/2504/2580 synthase
MSRRRHSPPEHPRRPPAAPGGGAQRSPFGGRTRHGRWFKQEKPALWKPGPGARVVRTEAGMDLAHFLAAACKGAMSVRAVRRHLEEGCCRIDGRVETFGSRELKAGEVVEFLIPESHEHHYDPHRLVFDADGLIAYDKPAWLPVTPTDGPKSWSLLDILSAALGHLIPVHRLDADTSGLVIMARVPAVARRLEEAFHDHAVRKTYLAIVRGHPPEKGSRRTYLVKVESRQGFERWASGRGPEAREAITDWEVEARLGPYASLVRIEPKTGRHHQIRLHFSEMGFPIYGDRIYGDRQDPIHVGRHLLHAGRIRLPHPAGGADLDLTAPAPREFAEADKLLRKL